LDATLTYDAPGLRLIRVRRPPQAARIIMAVNSSEPGRVRVAMASAQPVAVRDQPVLIAEFAGTGTRAAVRLARGEAEGVEQQE